MPTASLGELLAYLDNAAAAEALPETPKAVRMTVALKRHWLGD